MIRSYIHTALRSFKRNGIVASINLLGLSIGLAASLVAGLYIKHELSADQFHRDVNDIYRATVKFKIYNLSLTPHLFTETIATDFPAVKETLRTMSEKTVVRIADENNDLEILFADPNFFSFFTFPFQLGNERQALKDLKGVVVSDAIRERYFGAHDPVGETIRIKLNNKFEDFVITGVTRPTSTYSSIHFDFVVPLENKFTAGQGSKDNWYAFAVTSFIKADAENIKELESAMPDFIRKYVPDAVDPDGTTSMNFVLSAFAKHHLGEGVSGSGLTEGRSVKGLFVFAGIALLILLLACFNFMNLTNAQSSKRMVEVGVRKVVGAGRGQLIRQFLAEALVLSMIAAVFAFGIAELNFLLFGDLLEVSISVFDSQHTDVYVSLLVITIGTGFLAGGYPAFVLSGINSLGSFRRHYKIGGNNFFTRSVLSLQFGLSIILIVCAITMWKQQHFMMNKDLGYNKEQVLVLPISNRDTATIGVLKNEIKKYTETLNVTKTSGSFTRGNNVSFQKMPDNSNVFIYMLGVDEDYLNTMQMELAAGTMFNEDNMTNPSAIMVNEAFVKKLDLGDSIGMKLGRAIGPIHEPVVIGVVKDFHHASLRQEIEPMILLHDKTLNNSYLNIKLAAGKIVSGIEKIDKLWKKTNTDSPFEYFFLDDDIDKQYASERRWSNIITVATCTAIFLSVLGLIGLAMFTAEQRKKEIGIRKVLGATLKQLVALLSKDYLWLIGGAFFIAVPISYYLIVNYWLQNFDYRIEMDVMIYFAAFAVVLLIAGLAIGSQMVRAAIQNPVDTLKEE